MKRLGALVLIVGCLKALPCSGAGEVEATVMKKLADANVKLDLAAVRSWRPQATTSTLVPGSVAEFVDSVTDAKVIILGGFEASGSASDFHNDKSTLAQLDERKRMISEKFSGSTIDDSGLREINGYTYLWLHYTTKAPAGALITGTGHGALFSTIRDGRRVGVLAIGRYASDANNAADTFVKAIAPMQKNPAPPVGNFEDYQGKAHGFETHLREAGWQTWERANELFFGNFIAARYGDSAFLVVLVLPMPARPMTIDDHFNATLRISTRFNNPESQLKPTRIKMKPFDEAISFSGDTADGGSKFHFGGWFGQGGGRMMLAMTWCNASVIKDTEGAVISTLAAIQPLPLDRAPVLALFTKDQRQRQSDVLCEIAAQLLRRGRNEDAAAVYDQALDCSHELIATLEAAVIGLQQIGDFSRAETLLGRYWSAFKDSPRAWLMRARLRSEAGEKDKALADYTAAFNTGLRDEQALLQLMMLFWESSKFDDALKFIEAYDKRAPSPRVTRWRAVTLARMKDYDHALPIYETLIKTRPLDVEAAMQYGEFANQAGKHDLAMQMADMLINEHQDGPRTRVMQGWAHYGKKEWREAKLSFEAARKFAPNDSIVLEALNAANAALGEGDSSAVKELIEALVLPTEVQQRLDAAATAFKADDDQSATNLLMSTQIRFVEGKPTTTTVRRRVQMLDTAGVDAFTTLDINFDPLSERVFVNKLEVLDASGKVIATTKPEDQYVTDPSMDGPATLGRVLRVPVPGLKPGRVLDYAFTKRTLDSDKAMRYTYEWFGSQYPTAAQAMVLEGDVKQVRVVMNEVLSKQVQTFGMSSDKMHAWVVAPAFQWHSEPLLPRFSTFAPMIWLGAPDEDWTKVGKEYLDLIKDKLEPESDITELAKRLTEGSKSDEEKIDKLSRHVREEITYKAIEFGRRARIPNKASRITANHYGDCKDMSLLLHQLLAAVGIESHLTLIHNKLGTLSDLPDLDQFNHMILHVPKLKAQFVDCTEGKSAGVNLPPQLFGFDGFVLDPDQPKLLPMPKRNEWTANKLHSRRTVRLDSEGGADVNEELEFAGYMAHGMRGFLNSMPPQKRIDSLQSWLQRASHWQLERLEAVDLSDPAQPLTLKLRYSIPPPAQSGANGVEIPAVFESEYLDIAYLRKRHHPFELLHSLDVTSDVHVIATTPFEASSLQALSRRETSEKHCTWTMAANADTAASNECRVRFELHWPAEEGAAEGYSVMRKAAAAAASAWEVPVRMSGK